jgi:hypothetical protein
VLKRHGGAGTGEHFASILLGSDLFPGNVLRESQNTGKVLCTLLSFCPDVKQFLALCRQHMICPVELADEVSPLRAARARHDAKYGLLFE